MHQKPYLGTCLGQLHLVPTECPSLYWPNIESSKVIDLWTSDKNFREHPVRERKLSTTGIKMCIKNVIIDNYGNHKE